MKKFSYFLDSNMIGSLQCSFCCIKYLTDFTVFHLLIVSEIKHCALHVGQFGNSLLQLCFCLIAVEVVVGKQRIGYP